MKKQISAEIIADSINKTGDRVTTFVVTFPRIVLAELNTHRVFSRNSASSRAIPFDKMVKMVEEDPFIPIKWQKNHSGMQGTEYFEGRDVDVAISNWLSARDSAKIGALNLNAHILGEGGTVTKQLCNRLLEPFMWHTAIITSTDFENFFALRAHPEAEIHIAKLAEVMLETYNESIPKELNTNEWHIPFGDKIDLTRLNNIIIKGQEMSPYKGIELMNAAKIKIATARCARVSYLNFEGKDDYEADIKLHDRLAEMGHWSPFEHCARTMNDIEELTKTGVATYGADNQMFPETHGGNFTGFIQYRKMFEQENKSDERVNK